MGYFDLPTRDVYVEFEDGKKMCVACDDTLNADRASYYKQTWENEERKVKRVWLEDNKGNTLCNFVNENGNMVEAGFEIKVKKVQPKQLREVDL